MEEKKMIDMRSDTVTKPTKEMFVAMENAKIGSDTFGDDPTIKELEILAADITGFESSIFVPSGCMSNLISIMLHCNERGSEMIVGNESHIHNFEQGNSAWLGGVHSVVLNNNNDGTINIDDIKNKIKPNFDSFAKTKLVCLENTHNNCGGKVLPLGYIQKVAKLCKEHKIALHLDGARIFNAAVALNVDVKELTEGADSLTVCLSKGLGSPIGSMLCGSSEFIKNARRYRKALGGQMQQILVAACGILSLTKMVKGLSADHKNAKKLYDGLKDVDGLDFVKPDTNLVFTGVDKEKYGMDNKGLVAALKKEGILVCAIGTKVRFCTHHQISKENIDFVIGTVKKLAE